MRTIVPSHRSRKRRGLDGAVRFHGIMKHEQFEWATCPLRWSRDGSVRVLHQDHNQRQRQSKVLQPVRKTQIAKREDQGPSRTFLRRQLPTRMGSKSSILREVVTTDPPTCTLKAAAKAPGSV
jgi:hypothetical protein